MKKIQPFNTLTIVGLELGIACVIFLFSPYGYSLLYNLEGQLNTIRKDIFCTRSRIQGLEREIADWKQHPFFKEKYCRENLQMVYPETTTYYIE